VPIALHTLSTQVTLAAAIGYALSYSWRGEAQERRPADVLSCSVDLFARVSDILGDVLDWAATKTRKGAGTAVFWAVPPDGDLHYISIDDHPICKSGSVIPVAAIGEDARTRSGLTGERLAFVAPGESVWGCWGDRITSRSGSSYATACAAGVAALLIAKQHTLTRKDLFGVLTEACDADFDRDRTGLESEACYKRRYGHGRLRANKALQAVRE
jgi:subtilisin family serine protease